MARVIAEIERDIAELPTNERAKLLRALILGLDAPAESDVEQTWIAESKRRLAEIDNGKAKTVSGHAVLDEARSLIK